MTIYKKISGVFTQLETPWLKNGGSWKRTINIWGNDSGTWKKIYSEGIIGSVIATVNHINGYETPDECWQECDGSEITDTDSPLVGENTPNLNGTTEATKIFIRGSTASGTTGGTSTHAHSLSSSITIGTDYNANTSNSGINGAANIPPAMDVKYYMRIK